MVEHLAYWRLVVAEYPQKNPQNHNKTHTSVVVLIPVSHRAVSFSNTVNASNTDHPCRQLYTWNHRVTEQNILLAYTGDKLFTGRSAWGHCIHNSNMLKPPMPNTHCKLCKPIWQGSPITNICVHIICYSHDEIKTITVLTMMMTEIKIHVPIIMLLCYTTACRPLTAQTDDLSCFKLPRE